VFDYCPDRSSPILEVKGPGHQIHGGGGITSGMNGSGGSPIAAKLVGNSELGTRLGHSDLGAAASTKAIWWDFRLASLLPHLLLSHHTVVWGYLVYCM